ncbi:cell division protein SepF [Candidatus Woesearchaeota archaeon]|nr:cell division protein SepF [Candidatus Woesearchaeota archaeon]MBW2993943.1 cell division protein SepF [Candidatus Woesearchaeota archaeon]
MKNFFSSLKAKMSSPKFDELDEEEGYVELDSDALEPKTKILVRPFILEDFEDMKPILDSLREGHTIALVNIKPLKERDLIELKRAINKLKKTTDAIDGEIAGFGEDYVVVTPSFATIHKTKHLADMDPMQ